VVKEFAGIGQGDFDSAHRIDPIYGIRPAHRQDGGDLDGLAGFDFHAAERIAAGEGSGLPGAAAGKDQAADYDKRENDGFFHFCSSAS
jgi:hypothetical protein